MPNKNQLFCSMPFRFIEVCGWCPPKGDVFICCPNWLRVSIGNILQCHSFEEIWNGEKARGIRRSILDGSFEYCEHSMCPCLQTISRPVERIGDIRDEELIAIIENHMTVLPYGPREIRCSYDKSCNLSCPSCRTEVIIERAHEQQIREIQNRLQNELVRTTEISIDAASSATYSVNRRGGSFERLLKNLEFISELRKNGPLNKVTISMVVQRNNFKEMPDFVNLGKRFDFDLVSFSRLMNWGTFSEEEFTSRAIHLTSHPDHQELLEILRNKVLHEPIVYLGNLTDLIQR
jgi:hypothetical protein